MYLIGLAILILGLAYAAWLAGVSTEWIVAGVLVIVGFGITRAARARLRDPSRR